MIPDPATTPIVKGRQIAFGVSVAIVYAALQLFHIVFGLFLALIAVCAVRGLCIAIASAMSKAKTKSQPITRVSIPTARPAFPVVEKIAVLEEVRA